MEFSNPHTSDKISKKFSTEEHGFQKHKGIKEILALDGQKLLRGGKIVLARTVLLNRHSDIRNQCQISCPPYLGCGGGSGSGLPLICSSIIQPEWLTNELHRLLPAIAL